MITLTFPEWEAEGLRRFGPDRYAWRFVCPSCGHVAAARDWHAAGAPQGAVAFSCVGRTRRDPRPALGSGPGPCDHGGELALERNPVRVVTDDGRSSVLFAFAEPA